MSGLLGNNSIHCKVLQPEDAPGSLCEKSDPKRPHHVDIQRQKLGK